MRKPQHKTIFYIMLTAVVPIFLWSCSDGGDDVVFTDKPITASYHVTVENNTSHQPFSPAAVVLHKSGYTAWETGGAASEGLERLAEGGSVDLFLEEAEGSDDVFATGARAEVIAPGNSQSVNVSALMDSDFRLSLAAMLVNTNDAFTGISGVRVGDLGVNESVSLSVAAYDAGTEADAERAETIPGPAGGGEGYNVARDDNGYVTVHPGVVTMDDGLNTSVLDESHRWLNPVAKITITRTE